MRESTVFCFARRDPQLDSRKNGCWINIPLLKFKLTWLALLLTLKFKRIPQDYKSSSQVFLSQLSFCAGNENRGRRMKLRITTNIELSTNFKTVLYLSRPELVLIRRNLHKPWQETTIIDQWLPLGLIPEWLDRKLAGNFKKHGQKGVL